MVSTFLFDIGNVIIHFDFGKATRRIAPACEVSPEVALEKVAVLTPPLERGELTVEEFIDAASERIGYRGSRRRFLAAFEDIFELNEPVVKWIESLHGRNFPLHLLSNTNAIHVPFFEARYPVFSLFSGRIYSHEVGVMKPDPLIYEKTIEILGIDPATTLYLDDLPENCAAGRAAGFQSLVYERARHPGIEREIEELLRQ